MNVIRQPETKAIVSVDGERVHALYLKISQRMAAHHDFELKVDLRTFDPDFFHAPEKKLTLVNSKVIIDLQPGDNIGKAYTFSGLVTSVRMLAEEGMHGALLLTGKSNTVDLERGRICQTYANTNLYHIFKEVTADTRNLTVLNQPDWKSDIAFAIQYKETDWSFVARMCHQYNCQFHYNGTDLIIGNYPEYPVVNLTYDLELRSLEMCSRLLSNEETNYTYRREDHQTLTQDSPKEIDGANYYLQQVSKKADYLTRKRKPNAPLDAYAPDMDSLMNQMARKKVATGAEMMYIQGEVKCCDVLIGRLVRIQMPRSMGGQEIGTYRVYEVIHEINQNGRYNCRFEAVPADLKYLPTPEVKIPSVNPIQVECWSNEDPLGIGRVKVKFPFDEHPCEIFIPQMTPDAGGNGFGLGARSRGYSFVAEAGDALLVYFLDEQLSQPFVMGSMFHGENADLLGGGKGNHLKTITDKTEGQIVMNTDKSGNWGISIRDVNGNLIQLHTRDKTIRIFAPESITLDSKLIRLNAADNLEMNVTNSLLINAFKNMFVHAPIFQQFISKTSHFQSGNMLINTPDGELKIEGKNVITSGEEKLYLHSSSNITANSTGHLNIQGETGTSMSNVAEEYENKKEEITSRCVISFRTSGSYQGEYGFDWVRGGDSGRGGDRWYAEIMGRYSGATFNKDVKEYDKFVAEFQRFVIPWKKAAGSQNYVYTVAVMTLLKDRKATLTLKMEVDEQPKEIKYEYDKAYFSLNKDTVTPKPKGKHTLADDLVITCVAEFAEDQYIDVIAVDQNDIEQFSGRILVKANDKEHRYKANIVLVRVTTNITGSPKTGNAGGKANNIKKFLEQCYITSNIETKSMSMTSTARNSYLLGLEDASHILRNPNASFYNSLNTYFNADHPGYSDYYKVYIINERFYSASGGSGLAGKANGIGCKEVIVCGGGVSNSWVSSHELFHAFNLYHSFDSNSKFIFQFEKTDNIMDYGSNPKLATWQFQWERARTGLPKE